MGPCWRISWYVFWSFTTPLPSFADVASTRGHGELPIEVDPERDGRSARRRPHHEVHVARVEAECDPAAGLVQHGSVAGHGPLAGESPVVEREPAGRAVHVRPIEPSDVLLGETGALPVPDVRLGRTKRAPVGGDLETLRLDRDQIRVDGLRAGIEQQLLDDHLGHRVLPLAEVVEADPALASAR